MSKFNLSEKRERLFHKHLNGKIGDAEFIREITKQDRKFIKLLKKNRYCSLGMEIEIDELSGEKLR